MKGEIICRAGIFAFCEMRGEFREEESNHLYNYICTDYFESDEY